MVPRTDEDIGSAPRTSREAPPETPPQPHDRSYRSFYSYPEIVEGTVRNFGGGTWVEEIDFSTLRQLPDVFVSEKLARRDADTVWQAQYQDRPVLLYFAFEFQSSPLWYMAARTMTTEGLLYLRLIDKGILPPGKLPLIVTLVVYNGLGLPTLRYHPNRTTPPHWAAEDLSEGVVEAVGALARVTLNHRHRRSIQCIATLCRETCL